MHWLICVPVASPYFFSWESWDAKNHVTHQACLTRNNRRQDRVSNWHNSQWTALMFAQNLRIIVIPTVIRVCTQPLLLLLLYQKLLIHSEYFITLSCSLMLNTSRGGWSTLSSQQLQETENEKSSLKNINTHELRKTKGEIVWNKFRSPFDSVHWNV